MTSAPPDPDSRALHDLLDRWVAGWCVSRGIGRDDWHGGFIAHVQTAKRELEYFVVSPSGGELDELAALAGGRSDVWVSVLGSQPAPPPPGLVAITHAERMMAVELAPRILPDGVAVETIGGVTTATVTVGGELAAHGQVGVDGADAVFDRITTEAAFRRRGLASRIMIALEHEAVAAGASRGLLMASVLGRPLYRSLGWREVAPFATFTGAPVTLPQPRS